MYAKLSSWENLLLAFRRAAKGKRGRPNVAAFEYRLEENLLELQEELCTRTYCPRPYTSFYIHEPKRRLISAAPFRDRVQKLARRFPYVLQCDIRQFFPSIDHAILRDILAGKIGDSGILWLIDRILESGIGVLKADYEMVYFSGDDLFAVNRARGLPIGNLTSQFWANCYLNPFDHFVKRELRCPGYVRYVDDFLLFGKEKVAIWGWKKVSPFLDLLFTPTGAA